MLRKFKGPKDPLAAEAKKTTISAPPQVAAHYKEEIYRQMLQNASEHEKLAINIARKQHIDQQVTAQVDDEFAKSFQNWVLKRGRKEDHVRAGWWDKDSKAVPKFLSSGGLLSSHPSVTAYVKDIVLARHEFEQKLVHMKAEAQTVGVDHWPIDKLYLYYKYVVRGLDLDDEDCYLLKSPLGDVEDLDTGEHLVEVDPAAPTSSTLSSSSAPRRRQPSRSAPNPYRRAHDESYDLPMPIPEADVEAIGAEAVARHQATVDKAKQQRKQEKQRQHQQAVEQKRRDDEKAAEAHRQKEAAERRAKETRKQEKQKAAEELAGRTATMKQHLEARIAGLQKEANYHRVESEKHRAALAEVLADHDNTRSESDSKTAQQHKAALDASHAKLTEALTQVGLHEATIQKLQHEHEAAARKHAEEHHAKYKQLHDEATARISSLEADKVSLTSTGNNAMKERDEQLAALRAQHEEEKKKLAEDWKKAVNTTGDNARAALATATTALADKDSQIAALQIKHEEEKKKLSADWQAAVESTAQSAAEALAAKDEDKAALIQTGNAAIAEKMALIEHLEVKLAERVAHITSLGEEHARALDAKTQEIAALREQVAQGVLFNTNLATAKQAAEQLAIEKAQLAGSQQTTLNMYVEEMGKLQAENERLTRQKERIKNQKAEAVGAISLLQQQMQASLQSWGNAFGAGNLAIHELEVEKTQLKQKVDELQKYVDEQSRLNAEMGRYLAACEVQAKQATTEAEMANTKHQALVQVYRAMRASAAITDSNRTAAINELSLTLEEQNRRFAQQQTALAQANATAMDYSRAIEFISQGVDFTGAVSPGFYQEDSNWDNMFALATDDRQLSGDTERSKLLDAILTSRLARYIAPANQYYTGESVEKTRWLDSIMNGIGFNEVRKNKVATELLGAQFAYWFAMGDDTGFKQTFEYYHGAAPTEAQRMWAGGHVNNLLNNWQDLMRHDYRTNPTPLPPNDWVEKFLVYTGLVPSISQTKDFYSHMNYYDVMATLENKLLADWEDLVRGPVGAAAAAAPAYAPPPSHAPTPAAPKAKPKPIPKDPRTGLPAGPRTPEELAAHAAWVREHLRGLSAHDDDVHRFAEYRMG